MDYFIELWHYVPFERPNSLLKPNADLSLEHQFEAKTHFETKLAHEIALFFGIFNEFSYFCYAFEFPLNMKFSACIIKFFQ